MMAFVDDGRFLTCQGESRMLPHLVRWLRSNRWVRPDSVIVQEFPINGRRVDLVTMTRSGKISAFELKLGGFARVLEQATYNRRNFDRSWIVVGNNPRPSNIAEAERFGIGIIVVSGTKPTVLVRPGPPQYDERSRTRSRKRLMEIGEMYV